MTSKRTAGIIGGIGPESTIDYYRSIVARYSERLGQPSYPSLIINCIDLTRMMSLIYAERLDDLESWFAEEVQRLADAGAHFGALTSNTPHSIFEGLSARSPIPLVSIVRTACDAALAQGLKRVGLLGTRITMQGRFYPDTFEKAGIELVTPSAGEQSFVHDKYMNELLHGIVNPQSRAGILAVVERMRTEEGIEGLLIAGTELPLALRGAREVTIPMLDTSQLHVARIVDLLLAD